MKSSELSVWIDDAIKLCQPSETKMCTGSEEEYRELCALLVSKGTFTQLNPNLRPNSFLARSDPLDVARTEEKTYICSETEEEPGPTNHWFPPDKMKTRLKDLFQGCMRGRTMYIIPFCMGHPSSPLAQIGMQITDSAYVVCNTKLMTFMGAQILDTLKKDPEREFIPCMHSVGRPLLNGIKDSPWPCNIENVTLAHFPQTREIWSFGSGYGGNALLGKKCLALRIASVLGRDHGWLAEHMLIIGVTNPAGEKKYIAGAFPSACGKTNLAMLTPTLPGWKVETVGDDIAWMQFRADGKLYAINPERGFFGVAPGTSPSSNPNAIKTLTHDAIFTNVGLTKEGDVWWEGLTKTPPDGVKDWLNQTWDPAKNRSVAQPNGRFTVAAAQCPIMDRRWEDPEGVPISAIIFGGRRSNLIPLVRKANSWNQGVFFGASLSSETTAAASGEVGQLRHDPFAMLPFCGYHMGDYFSHWIDLGQKHASPSLPKIYQVNWFRKGAQGEYLWPGYGENSRILKWIFETCDTENRGIKTAIGTIPDLNDLDLTGLSIRENDLKLLFEVNPGSWKDEAKQLQRYFAMFKDHLPEELKTELNHLTRFAESNQET